MTHPNNPELLNTVLQLLTAQGASGHAKGFKPKTLATRVGEIDLRVPQVRGGVSFHPSALEKGVRSEQALLLAMAGMHVQGVSTRKVSKIVGELCAIRPAPPR